jgi:thiamine biosynthesis lipoprotein
MIELVHRFPAMGSECTLTITSSGVSAAAELASRAEAVVAHLESLWSRFRPDSELMLLNQHSGSSRGVGPDTFSLIGASIEAWRQTGGLFDPTMLDALVDAGYDCSFEDLRDHFGEAAGDALPPPESPVSSGARGPDAIVLDVERAFVTLPEDVHLDLGGIAKGAAADTVADVLERGGAFGACVDLGGDIAVFGHRCDGQPWAIAVDDPTEPGVDLAIIQMERGAVATSSRVRRRWVCDGQDAHHLIDPRTGQPAITDLLSVSVVASSAMWAEVFAKAALIAGSIEGERLLASAELPALFVIEGGGFVPVGDIGPFLCTVDVA